jgi:hypothetical protein
MYVLSFQQIVFEGTWGSSRANGFIGFDDITFFSAACSSKFILTSVLPIVQAVHDALVAFICFPYQLLEPKVFCCLCEIHDSPS